MGQNPRLGVMCSKSVDGLLDAARLSGLFNAKGIHKSSMLHAYLLRKLLIVSGAPVCKISDLNSA